MEISTLKADGIKRLETSENTKGVEGHTEGTQDSRILIVTAYVSTENICTMENTSYVVSIEKESIILQQLQCSQ